MHRFATLIVLLLVVALALVGCGGAAPAPTAAPAAPAEEAAAPAEQPAAPAEEAAAPAASGEPFKIAFVLPSSITDLAWARPCTMA